MHLTTFQWIPPSSFEVALVDLQRQDAVRSWDLETDGKTDTYVVWAPSK